MSLPQKVTVEEWRELWRKLMANSGRKPEMPELSAERKEELRQRLEASILARRTPGQ